MGSTRAGPLQPLAGRSPDPESGSGHPRPQRPQELAGDPGGRTVPAGVIGQGGERRPSGSPAPGGCEVHWPRRWPRRPASPVVTGRWGRDRAGHQGWEPRGATGPACRAKRPHQFRPGRPIPKPARSRPECWTRGRPRPRGWMSWTRRPMGQSHARPSPCQRPQLRQPRGRSIPGPEPAGWAAEAGARPVEPLQADGPQAMWRATAGQSEDSGRQVSGAWGCSPSSRDSRVTVQWRSSSVGADTRSRNSRSDGDGPPSCWHSRRPRPGWRPIAQPRAESAVSTRGSGPRIVRGWAWAPWPARWLRCGCQQEEGDWGHREDGRDGRPSLAAKVGETQLSVMEGLHPSAPESLPERRTWVGWQAPVAVD